MDESVESFPKAWQQPGGAESVTFLCPMPAAGPPPPCLPRLPQSALGRSRLTRLGTGHRASLGPADAHGHGPASQGEKGLERPQILRGSPRFIHLMGCPVVLPCLLISLQHPSVVLVLGGFSSCPMGHQWWADTSYLPPCAPQVRKKAASGMVEVLAAHQHSPALATASEALVRGVFMPFLGSGREACTLGKFRSRWDSGVAGVRTVVSNPLQ